MKTMQRQRGELVPIGDAVYGLDDVPALREASPQAMRLSWPTLYRQFGAHPSKASDNNTVQ